MKIKLFLTVILTGKTRTPTATRELRILFSDLEVAKIVNKNIKSKSSFTVTSKYGKTYKISNI